MLGYILFAISIAIVLMIVSSKRLRTRRIMIYLAVFLVVQYLVTVHFTWEATGDLAWVMKVTFFLFANAALGKLMKPFVKD